MQVKLSGLDCFVRSKWWSDAFQNLLSVKNYFLLDSYQVNGGWLLCDDYTVQLCMFQSGNCPWFSFWGDMFCHPWCFSWSGLSPLYIFALVSCSDVTVYQMVDVDGIMPRPQDSFGNPQEPPLHNEGFDKPLHVPDRIPRDGSDALIGNLGPLAKHVGFGEDGVKDNALSVGEDDTAVNSS